MARRCDDTELHFADRDSVAVPVKLCVKPVACQRLRQLRILIGAPHGAAVFLIQSARRTDMVEMPVRDENRARAQPFVLK